MAGFTCGATPFQGPYRKKAIARYRLPAYSVPRWRSPSSLQHNNPSITQIDVRLGRPRRLNQILNHLLIAVDGLCWFRVKNSRKPTMLRAQLRRISLPLASRQLSRTSPSKRTIWSFHRGYGLAPVPVFRPALWALAATATIYIGCAAYDVRRDVQDAKRRGAFKEGRVGSYEDLEEAKYRSHGRHHRTGASSASRWNPPGQIGEMLAGYNDAEKFILGVVALNLALVGACKFAPGPLARYLGHIPVLKPNFTLLTSCFGHSGWLHVGLNSLVLYQFGTHVASYPAFQGNGSHFAAFYLSTGILSALGDHFATMLPTRLYRIRRLGFFQGTGGIIMASKFSGRLFLFSVIKTLDFNLTKPDSLYRYQRQHISVYS